MIPLRRARLAWSRSALPKIRSFSTTTSIMKPLTVDGLNPALLKVQYAVRGELAIKAEEHRNTLKQENHTLPFDKVISSNIGNPQQKGLDQPPITFTRQVAALMEWPALAELAPGVFPEDVVARAKELRDEIGSIGAYSHSQGVPLIRQSVAKFIEDRDGYPSSPANIFLTTGASAGVSLLISMLISAPTDGILIPIPQYPLYTATLAQHRGVAIPYPLSESDSWSTSLPSIESAISTSLTHGITPKALVIINPGNPTGALLTPATQESLIRLCEKHNLVLLADEVYQTNLHRPDTHPFTSFKKLVSQLASPIPLISFHSISKGTSGECGRRGGYFECTNVAEDVLALIYKMASVTLCPPLQGQIGVDCMVRPPRPGDASYEQYQRETGAIARDLAARTGILARRLNALEGVSCVESPGALYLYPRVIFPPTAVEAARARGKGVDALYAMEMLNETGICVVPGSGFELGESNIKWAHKQEELGEEVDGHFRLTCLCPGVEEYVGKMEEFHKGFLKRYA